MVLVLLLAGCSRVVTLELPPLEGVPVTPPAQSYVYDADGRQLAVLRHEFRERVDLDAVPAVLVDAVVATEDQRFWDHDGIDARAVLRAALTNVAAGEVRQGGSTITQQLVESLYLRDAPVSAETKLREALLARQLEQERSKDQILEEYLNTVYFGSGAYGVQAAAATYWRKDVGDLRLPEAALLAGLIRSPETLNPHRHPERARQRRDHILDRMLEEGVIGADEAAAAADRPVAVRPAPPRPETREPHWVDFVVRELLADPTFGPDEAARARRLFGGGLRIHTTLDAARQRHARAAIAATLDREGDPDGAIVSVAPDSGRIVAAAGSRAYEQLQFDLATQARRQPGSTFKTFVLTAAVSAGMGPEAEIDSDPGTLQTPNGPWTVRNYTGRSYGDITLAAATRASVNAVFARLILELGTGRVAGLARAMGVRSPINEDPPIALGGVDPGLTPLDMAASYATLANLGEHVTSTPIDRIEDEQGEVVWRPEQRRARAVDPSAAFVVTRLLRDVVEAGTGIRAQVPGWEVAGKTGTTQDHADAWFVGYTPVLATAVWVGHAEGRVPMRDVHGFPSVGGGTLPALLFADYMTAALDGVEPVPFALPSEYYEIVELDPETGLLAAPWCAGEPTPVPRVVVPDEQCPSPPPAPASSPSPAPAPSPSRSPQPPDGGPDTGEPPATPSPSPSPAPSPSPSPQPGPSPRDGTDASEGPGAGE